MVKGLSKDEKKKRMLEFFHESQSFFQLKDVEKICSTEKGITLNTCKDILLELADDGFVDSEKIGTSLYYWSLPSKALATKSKEVTKMQADLKLAEEKNVILKEKLEALKEQQSSQEDNEEKRSELTNSLQELENVRRRLIGEVNAFKENDPEICHKMRREIKMSKEATNRWVENIFGLMSWMKKKFNCQDAMLEKQFDIPSDLDYVS